MSARRADNRGASRRGKRTLSIAASGAGDSARAPTPGEDKPPVRATGAGTWAAQATDLTIAVLGCGRLGRAVEHAARAQGLRCLALDGQTLRAARHSGGARATAGTTRVASAGAASPPPAQLATLRHDAQRLVLVDASVGEAVSTHLDWALALELPLVIGATGHGFARSDLAARVRRSIGVLVAPNFALGALLLGRLAEAVGAWAGPADLSGFLEERHHAAKRDAPSGTAIWLRGRFESSGGGPLPISATRAGVMPGSHVIGLSAPGELIEMRHTALDREAYGRGAIAACRYIAGRLGVHGIEEWAAQMFPWPNAGFAGVMLVRPRGDA